MQTLPPLSIANSKIGTRVRCIRLPDVLAYWDLMMQNIYVTPPVPGEVYTVAGNSSFRHPVHGTVWAGITLREISNLSDDVILDPDDPGLTSTMFPFFEYSAFALVT